MYTLSKLFSAVSYSSRNKYLSNNDKFIRLLFRRHKPSYPPTNLNQEQNQTEEKVGASIRDRSTSTKDEVVPFRKFVGQNRKPNKKDCSLGFIFPDNCVEVQKEIKATFDEETEKAFNASKAFKACFGNYAIGALFWKEKKALSTHFKKQTLIKSTTFFRRYACGQKSTHERQKKVLGTSVRTRAGLYDFLLTFSNTYLQEY